MQLNSVEDLFIYELSDMYSAEKQLTRALPKLAKAANDQTLEEAFTNHQRETEMQVKRIEKIAADCGFKLKRKKCEAMEGLISEGASMINELEPGALRDMALISAAQKVEHYEISGYTSLMKLAREMGDRKTMALLEKTLAEEQNADAALSKVVDEELDLLEVGTADDEEDTRVPRAA